tara:strand:- start:2118 stop:3512 length:1395 start_codon:yes stop_codon:yes gene_type:complete
MDKSKIINFEDIKHKVLGDVDAVWEDISCPNLNKTWLSVQGKEKHICELASKIAGEPCEVNPYLCSACTAGLAPQSESSQVVTNLIRKKNKDVKIETRKAQEISLGEGVGTEVHKMIPSWLEKPGCKCKDIARKMNIWGADGCENNRERIMQHLLKKANEVGFFGWVPDTAKKMVINQMLTTAINRVRSREGEDANKWYCAVTTAPRAISTLDTCLQSLQVAGFQPFVFAEPKSSKPLPEFEEFYMQNTKRKGVWWNWIDSLKYGIENTDANIFLTVQDDSLFHPDSKAFAEKILWPSQNVGFVSLYTPKHYSIKPKFKTKARDTGVNRIHTKSLWGACALIWPRAVVEAMLENDFLENWYGAPTRTKSAWERIKKERMKEPWRIQNSDTAIGKLMNRMERTMWFCDPSPVQHISLTSATGHGGNKGRRNCGRCANWEESLFDQIPLSDQGKVLENYKHKEIII